MTLYTAADLSEQVFQYLLQRHFRMKEAGKEFCFYLDAYIGKNIFLADDHKITLTFWDNICLDKAYSSALCYWFNLSIELDGSVWFWIPYKQETASPTPLLSKPIGFMDIDERWGQAIDGALTLLRPNLKLNLDKKRWEQGYTDGKNYQERLDNFFAKDFDKIQQIVKDQFAFDANEKRPDERPPVRAISPFQFEKMLNDTLLERNMTHARRTDWGKKSLATGLLSFEFWNFRGIQHVKVDGIPADAKWIFITGENGFGKSSVLQALALGLAGPEDLPKTETGENWLLAVEWFNGKEAIVNSLYGAQSVRGYQPNRTFAAYGSSRLQVSGSTEPLKQNERATQHIFNQNPALLNIENELIRARSYRGDQFDYIVQIVKNLIPDLAKIEVRTTGNYEEVLYYEKDREGGTYKPVKFNQLAAGFRNLIGFVGDMYLRLSAGQSGPVAPDALKGVVLIDEIELHLHPKYQKMLPGKLSKIFPHVQFIAATHSPIPLLGAPKESIVLTVTRTPETGISVEKVDIDLSKLLPNAILTSPVFGLDEILPAAAADSADVETEDSYESAKQMQDLKGKLQIMKAKLNVN